MPPVLGRAAVLRCIPTLRRPVNVHERTLKCSRIFPLSLLNVAAAPVNRRMTTTSNSAFVPGDYPAARRDDTVREDHFGRTIADPYRWLEDPDAEETKTFVEEQNKRTFKYLESHPKREAIKKRLTTLNDFPKYGCPFRRGDYYYQFRNSGLQPQSVMYQLKSLEAEPTVFLDPNTLEADGTAALSTYGFTHSGKLFAYGISRSGSDWVTVHVKGTGPDGKKYDDAVEWCKFTGLKWTHDDKGFFYNRYPAPAVGHDKAGTETGSSSNAMLYYHRLGTPQAEDILIYKNPKNPDHNYAAEISDDGDYLLMTTHPSCDPVNKLYIAKLVDKGIKGDVIDFQKVVDNFDAQYEYITNEGTAFTFKTNSKSPRYKVIKLDLSKVESGFKDVIPEKNEVLDNVICVNQNKLVAVYNEDVKHVLHVHDLMTGKFLRSIPLEIGTISSLTGRKEDEEFFFNTVSFLSPGIIKRHDFKTDKTTVFLETRLKEYDPSKFVVKQVFYVSKDGTKIPMFLISRKDMQRNGKNPTLLYGYGGFSVSIMPSFAFSWIAFVEHMSGVVAVANIRGGGEYGEDWHKAGVKDEKQNVFDDFQYAAKYLINEKYSNSSTIAINGGSNGGLLVGACINQAPELFGAACADVGVLDMCRFHKFTIGHAWRSDYGDPDIKEDLEYIIKYSPLHNIRSDAVYPTTLLTTGDHDDRVVPLHSLKFIAELQHKAKMNPNPLLIRVETKAGHGAGKPTQKRIEEAADKLSFFGLALKADWNE